MVLTSGRDKGVSPSICLSFFLKKKGHVPIAIVAVSFFMLLLISDALR